MMNIRISTHTDIGDKKQTNQDSILCLSDTINNRKVGLFIVADGCGGLAFGEEISNLIVTHFSRVWKNELAQALKAKKIRDKEIDALLEKSISEINSSAKNFGTQVKSQVGSTLSLLLTIDNRYYIKNVGDSRIYLKRGNKLVQLTEDQSLVADMIRNGELTKDEAKSFKRKNVLTMCIGVFERIMTYTKTGRVKSGDIFLLCCDGLHNMVSEKTMLDILNDKKLLFEDKAYEMRKTIETGKAIDNVSAVICKFVKKRNKKLILIAILIILMIISVYIFGSDIKNLLEGWICLATKYLSGWTS